MSDEGHEQPPHTEEHTLADDLERLIAVIKGGADREALSAWASTWMPLVAAVKDLAFTAATLTWRIRSIVVGGRHEPLFEEGTLEEIDQQLAELRASFPAASALFFGVDRVDAIIDQTIDAPRRREMLAEVAGKLETHLDDFVARLVERALQEDSPQLSVERLERFMGGLEAVVQEVLDRLKPVFEPPV